MKGLSPGRKAYSVSKADTSLPSSLPRTISMTSLFTHDGNISSTVPLSSASPSTPTAVVTNNNGSSNSSNTASPAINRLFIPHRQFESPSTANTVKDTSDIYKKGYDGLMKAFNSTSTVSVPLSFNNNNNNGVNSNGLNQAPYHESYSSPSSPPGSELSGSAIISNSLKSHDSNSFPIFPHTSDYNSKDNELQQHQQEQQQQQQYKQQVLDERISHLYNGGKSSAMNDHDIQQSDVVMIDNGDDAFAFDIFKLEESPEYRPAVSPGINRTTNVGAQGIDPSHLSYDQTMKENLSQVNKKSLYPQKWYSPHENFPFLPPPISLTSACAVDISDEQSTRELEKNHKSKKSNKNKLRNGNHDPIFHELTNTEKKKNSSNNNHKCFKDARTNNIFVQPRVNEKIPKSKNSSHDQTPSSPTITTGKRIPSVATTFDESKSPSDDSDAHRASTSFGQINQFDCSGLRSPISKEKFDDHLIPPSPLRQTPSMVMLDAAAASFEQNREETLQRFENIQSSNPVYKVIAPCIEESASFGSSSVSASPTDKSTSSGPLAVFKETTNNEIERSGLLAREVILRERAAYVLDKNSKGFSNVPPTALAKISKEKRGSLQQYVESIGNCEENPDLLNKIDAEQVHKIGILDIRIFNTDRHGGNILITKQNKLQKQMQFLNRLSSNTHSESSCEDANASPRFEPGSYDEDSGSYDAKSSLSSQSGCGKYDDFVLVPIDHSLSLPSIHFLSDAYFDWAYYESANIPFSQSTIQHILENIDVAQDQRSLRELGLREECIATNTACTILLQTAVSLNPPFATLSDFASILQRPYPPGHKLFDQHWSPFEYMIDEAFREAGESYEVRKVIASQNPKKDNPPPTKFYEALETIIRRNLQSGEWRNHIPL